MPHAAPSEGRNLTSATTLGGEEWLIAVAPPGELDDNARPRLEDIAAFRVPGDRLIKLHVATWYARPHFVHDECLFVNLENLDTNRRDFHAVPLSVGSGAAGPSIALVSEAGLKFRT
jgi:hypothetical protein